MNSSRYDIKIRQTSWNIVDRSVVNENREVDQELIESEFSP